MHVCSKLKNTQEKQPFTWFCVSNMKEFISAWHQPLWWNILEMLCTTLNSPSIIFAQYKSETDSPSLEFAHCPISYIIFRIFFSQLNFKFALRSEGKKGEIKTGAKFSLYVKRYWMCRIMEVLLLLMKLFWLWRKVHYNISSLK